MKTITKDKMIDGHFYLNREHGRGMRIGMWTKGLDKFWCFKPEIGGFVDYKLFHVEDVNKTREITFDPVVDITLKMKNDFKELDWY